MGGDLFKEFNPFGGERRLKEIRKPGDIATGLRKTLNKTAANGIRHHGENDRDSSRLLVESGRNCCALRDNQIWCRRQSFCYRLLKGIGSGRTEVKVDLQVLAFVQTPLAQAF